MSAENRQTVPERDLSPLWALFALIFFTPLPLASNRPWALALLGLLTGGLFVWHLWRSSERGGFPAWKVAKLPLTLLGAWMLLLAIQLVPLPISVIHALGNRLFYESGPSGSGAGIISLDPYSTQLYLAKACILSVVFWLVISLANSRRRMEQLVGVVIISGLLQALIGVLLMSTGMTFQLFFTPMQDARAHGTFVSPNNFAGYLELTLAVGIGLMIAKLDGRASQNWRHRLHGWAALLISEKAMLRLSLIIMVIGLIASRSRMGNAAFFASLLIAGLFAVIVAKRTARKLHDRRAVDATRSMIVFITSLIVLDVVIIGGVVGVEKVVERIEFTNMRTQVEQPVPAVDEGATLAGGAASVRAVPKHRYEESVEHRSEVARASVEIVRDFPWTGAGGGTFHLAFPHYSPPEVTGFWDHAHNDYAEIICDTGLLGLLLLGALVIHSLYLSAISLVRSREQFTRGIAFGSLMGIISLLIHGTVDFNFQNPAVAMLFLIVLSLPYLQSWRKR